MNGPSAPERDDLGVQGFTDERQYLEAEILVAVLDPVYCALAGVQDLGELGLRPAAMLARVADQRADPAEVILSHGTGP